MQLAVKIVCGCYQQRKYVFVQTTIIAYVRPQAVELGHIHQNLIVFIFIIHIYFSLLYQE